MGTSMNRNYSMTPIRAVQSFIDAKKAGQEPGQDSLAVIRTYKSWKEPELIGLKNASAYYPDIYFESDMDATIAGLLQKFKAKEVAHKF